MTKRITYCWDTSVVIAWLEGDTAAPLGDIDLVATAIDRNEASLLISVMVYAEVLSANHTEEEMQKFRDFLKRSNVDVANVDTRIADGVERIRSAGLQSTPKRSIKTPDATFMATALLYKSDVFHTLDPKLLKLNGSSIVDGLKITLPQPLTGTTSKLNPAAESPETPE